MTSATIATELGDIELDLGATSCSRATGLPCLGQRAARRPCRSARCPG
jgi:hypothetical protein